MTLFEFAYGFVQNLIVRDQLEVDRALRLVFLVLTLLLDLRELLLQFFIFLGFLFEILVKFLELALKLSSLLFEHEAVVLLHVVLLFHNKQVLKLLVTKIKTDHNGQIRVWRRRHRLVLLHPSWNDGHRNRGGCLVLVWSVER